MVASSKELAEMQDYKSYFSKNKFNYLLDCTLYSPREIDSEEVSANVEKVKNFPGDVKPSDSLEYTLIKKLHTENVLKELTDRFPAVYLKIVGGNSQIMAQGSEEIINELSLFLEDKNFSITDKERSHNGQLSLFFKLF